MEQKDSHDTGRRVWAIAAIIISVMVLLLSAAGTVGIWIARDVAVGVNDKLMESVNQLSGSGIEAASRLGEGVDEIQTFVLDIESAVDEVAQNVSDKGVVMTLLPPEKEQKIVDAADNIGETLNSITSAVESAFDLYNSVGDIPFINLPKPDETKTQTLEKNVQEIQDSVDQMAADIQDFREGAASEVSKISTAAAKVNDRLEITNQNLSGVEGDLADLQTRAKEWKDRFRMITIIAALVLTFMFIWTMYAMIILIKKYLAELQT
jgi:hypothetical protein